jgi:hypothetical protein
MLGSRSIDESMIVDIECRSETGEKLEAYNQYVEVGATLKSVTSTTGSPPASRPQ